MEEMILNMARQISTYYVCAAVILGGLIITFGLIWCILFVASKTIFEIAAHCKFWSNLVEVTFERIRKKAKKTHIPKAERNAEKITIDKS